MELRQLRYFVRVAETLHFGRAAEREHIAQSVISTQIAALEREIGVLLLERTSRRVSLTPAGEAFRDHATRTLDDLDRAVERARVVARSDRRRLRIGVFGEGAGPLTHLILSAFRDLHRDIDIEYIELSMVNQIGAILDGGVDGALLRLPVEDRRFSIEPLFSEPRVAALPSYHPLADAPTLSVADLLDEPFAVAGEGAPVAWRSYWSFDDQRGEQSRVGGEVRSISESLATIAYRGAVDTFPATAAEMYRHPGVRYVPLTDAEPSALAFVTLIDARNQDDALERFHRVARTITDQHIALIPGGVRLRPRTD